MASPPRGDVERFRAFVAGAWGAGDPAMARRALEQARALLAREEAARVILFGGGFLRETLLELCRTELVALGDDA